MMNNSGSGGRHEPVPCGVCGGDGRIENSFGQVGRCPACGGSGRKREDLGFHDVTKTKASHHGIATNRAATPEKQTWPTSPSGIQLATEIRDAKGLSDDTKTRLTREIIDHEATHGDCTKTFLKKVRKQFRPAG